MNRFSYQLYSSRNFPPLAETLSHLGEVGYSEIEGYGALFSEDTDLEALRAQIDETGLAMPTAHIGLDVLCDRPHRAIEIARVLGLEAIFAPFLPLAERPTTPSGWEAFGARLDEMAKPLQDAGLVVGWHNHAFEFEPVEAYLPMDLILLAGDSLKVELDVAWCVKGGADPLDWIATNGSRIAAAHIKDIAPEGECADEDGWADVGHGIMDWPPIMAALRDTPCRWFVAEHDNPKDHRRFAKRALAAMRAF